MTITPDTVSLLVGQTVQLTASPSNGVKWSTDNCPCAIVSKHGWVTAVGVGVAVITARRGSASATATITVHDPALLTPPQAVLTLLSTTGSVEDLVTVSTVGSRAFNATLVSGTLDWGDGSAFEGWTGVPPTPLLRTYIDAGTYTITLRVVDSNDLSGTASIQITLNSEEPPPPLVPHSPIAVLSFVSGVYTNQPVVLSTLGTTDIDGTIASYSLNWADGTIVSANTPPPEELSHTYTTAGTRSAVLTVTDNEGLIGTATRSVTVAEAPAVNLPPVAVLQWVSGTFTGELVVVSTSGTFDPSGLLASGILTWGDGMATAWANGDPALTYSHTYTSAGAKTITLVVTDTGQLMGQASIVRTILDAPDPDPPPGDWPLFGAKYVLEPIKTFGAVENAENTDPFWIHLHEGEAESVRLTLLCWSEHVGVPNRLDIPLSQLPAGYEIRYTVRGTPVTAWTALLSAAEMVVTIAQVESAGIVSGIHHFDLEVRGPDISQFQSNPLFLHAHIHGTTAAATVPCIAKDDMSVGSDYPRRSRAYPADRARMGPGVVYVNVTDRNFVGYPLTHVAAPWTPNTAPYDQTNLYQDEISPHGDLFLPHQFWWQEPPGTPDEGLKFVRSMPPKFTGTDARAIYSQTGDGAGDGTDFGYNGLRTMPFKDGPRGVAWASPYVTGQVDSTGAFIFVEQGGPLRVCKPNGEMITVAGWVQDPAKDPIWILKPLTTIRQNQVLRGTWSTGQYANSSGFRLPMDVAIDPDDENIWYVVGFHDHCVWKVVVADRVTWAATITVFAGAVAHTYGHVDATGTAARFKGPNSIVFDPVADCLYVADQDNDCVRKITRAGVVTTIIGAPGMGARLALDGATMRPEFVYDLQDIAVDRMQNRSLSNFVTAAAGTPDVYIPYTIRVDSNGHIILMEVGYGSIRRFHMSAGVPTGQADFLTGFVNWVPNPAQPNSNFNAGERAWVWMDVDRWGNSGPLDGIYWCGVVGSTADGEPAGHFNEQFTWCPSAGGNMRWVFGHDDATHPAGFGPREHTDPPHYPWLVAVDPAGGLWTSGIGEHGLCRLRVGRAGDPVPLNDIDYFYGWNMWWRLQDWSTLQDFSAGVPTCAMKYGWGGHNHLGFTDMWGLKGAGDSALMTAFEIPASVQASPTHLAYLLRYLRTNAGPD